MQSYYCGNGCRQSELKSAPGISFDSVCYIKTDHSFNGLFASPFCFASTRLNCMVSDAREPKELLDRPRSQANTAAMILSLPLSPGGPAMQSTFNPTPESSSRQWRSVRSNPPGTIMLISTKVPNSGAPLFGSTASTIMILERPRVVA
jgi:hypothetical protein